MISEARQWERGDGKEKYKSLIKGSLNYLANITLSGHPGLGLPLCAWALFSII